VQTLARSLHCQWWLPALLFALHPLQHEQRFNKCIYFIVCRHLTGLMHLCCISFAELRWMCHLWEPMRCWYQPLGFYLFMEAGALLGALALHAGAQCGAVCVHTPCTIVLPVKRHTKCCCTAVRLG
jgi:hypothetical protein